MLQSVQRILFITLSNIGDAVLATPTLETLHQLYPEAVIDIVTDSRSAQLYQCCPYRGEIFLKHKKLPLRGVPRLLHQLRRQTYDIAVDLRSDGLLWLIKARQKLWKIPNRYSRVIHSAKKHFYAIYPLCLHINPPATQVWLCPEHRDQARQLLGDAVNSRILILGAGANFAPKEWPTASFIKLIEILQNEFDTVVLLGNERDRSLTSAIAEASVLPALNLAGQTDLLTATAVLHHGRLFIGNDSGLSHIASSTRMPIVTVCGPSDPEHFYPWTKHITWIKDPNENITAIQPELVATRARELLQKAASDT